MLVLFLYADFNRGIMQSQLRMPLKYSVTHPYKI